MTHPTPLPRRVLWALALAVLVLCLALSACGGHAAPGSGGNANTTQQTNSGQTTGAANDIVTADRDIQATLQQLDAAQLDAGVDLSTQDMPVEP